MSKLDELQSAAMGDMDECRMSLYGIHQLLKSRTVRAAELPPALEGLDSMAREHCSGVQSFAAALLDELSPEQQRWRPLVEGIRSEAQELLAAIVEALSAALADGKRLGGTRLGAKARIELEQRVAVLADRLESQRDVSMAVAQGLRGHERECQLCDLLEASSSMAEAFAVRNVELLLVGGSEPPPLVVEVMRLVVHEELWRLTELGHEQLVAWWQPNIGLSLARRGGASGAPSSDNTIERVRRPLRALTAYQSQAATALVRELDMQVVRSADGVTVSAPLLVHAPRQHDTG